LGGNYVAADRKGGAVSRTYSRFKDSGKFTIARKKGGGGTRGKAVRKREEGAAPQYNLGGGQLIVSADYLFKRGRGAKTAKKGRKQRFSGGEGGWHNPCAVAVTGENRKSQKNVEIGLIEVRKKKRSGSRSQRVEALRKDRGIIPGQKHKRTSKPSPKVCPFLG